MVRLPRRPGDGASGLGRDVGEIVVRSGDRAALQVEPEAEILEQAHFEAGHECGREERVGESVKDGYYVVIKSRVSLALG